MLQKPLESLKMLLEENFPSRMSRHDKFEKEN
jgi:hypothetical protein